MNPQRKKRGSAFILALMVLAVLMVIGLSVSLISETEMSIGETEKIQNEQFFATEAGITAGVSGLLVTNNTNQINFVIPARGRDRSRTNLNVGYDVQTSGLAMINEGELPLTKINAGERYMGYFYHTRTLTRRTSWAGGQEVPTCDDITDHQLGSNLVSTAFYFAPAPQLSDEALADSSEIAESQEYCKAGSTEGLSVFDFVNFD